MGEDNILKFVKTALGDLDVVADEVEVELVKTVSIFTEIINAVAKDLDIAGSIIAIINPTLASEVITIAQFAGAIDAIFTVLESLSKVLTSENPEEELILDYEKVKNNVDKAIKIWTVQKRLVINSAKKIELKAVSFQNPISKIEKKITGGEGI